MGAPAWLPGIIPEVWNINPTCVNHEYMLLKSWKCYEFKVKSNNNNKNPSIDTSLRGDTSSVFHFSLSAAPVI